ncbi:GntR family transcriptional regulator [Streptomonospora nanhaiensis]|uniref:GntR family transcriptional regulator n=1 Tax=Streptomonospora nanhaiensis TaxID=1323731 RepID=A0A853BWE1_9ACTN|nr:GntR family transcriptional regulator [Streptomonospora nanhaiensis]NYI99300.1 GntR family transcriptional regulator [Streptomonospora nanhaiensis]
MSRYREIAAQLRSSIERGEYARGSTLPSEDRLAEEFGVSRPVVNRAVRLLRSEGLVRVERGKGTVVHEIAPIVRRANQRYTQDARERQQSRGAFATEVREMGHEPRSQIVQLGPVTPPGDVADLLRFEVDEVAAIRKRHMFADDVPVQIATSYVPWSIAAGTAITQEDTGPGGTYSRLADLGHAVTRFSERVSVRMPEADEAVVLRLAEDQPVYVIHHVAWAENQPVEVTVHVMPVHQWRLDFEWQADPA